MEAGTRSTGSTSKSSNKKPLLIVAIVAVLVLALVITGVLLFNSGSRYQKNISTIETTTQQMGGATITNYITLVAENVNWEELSADERAGTARYAVNLVINRAQEEGVSSFNILGMSEPNRQTLFLYTSSGEETITLFVGDEQVPVSLKR
ncbi:MAG: hypothetical protein FWD27_08760 [Coriobacteriia bacterium]|nr:hypothetical protein [Coriobacteriia bacterium]